MIRSIPIKYAENSISVKHAVYDDVEKCYVIVFSNGNICHCDENGNQEVFVCKQSIEYLTYAKKYKTYVAVCGDNVIRVSQMMQIFARYYSFIKLLCRFSLKPGSDLAIWANTAIKNRSLSP